MRISFDNKKNELMKKSIFLTMLYAITIHITFGENTRKHTYTNVVVDSVKLWKTGVALKDLTYKSYDTRLLKNIDEFRVLEKPLMTKYGSDPRKHYTATGFFRTQKIDGRWWIIDPEGYPQIVRGINAVRIGSSPHNKLIFAEKFKTETIWIEKVCDLFEDLGFNGLGAWSEHDLVIQNNKYSKQIKSITIELNFMKTFKAPVNWLSPVFDPDFPAYCNKRAQEIVSLYKNEKNLFGYFTDNELYFHTSNLVHYLTISDKTDPNRIAAENWLASRNQTINSITDKDKIDFLGYLTDKYYCITTAAIRKYDSNHMILGSRLHTPSKYVTSILHSESKYCDICSINNYEVWTPTDEQLKIWTDNLTIPYMITEFYAKAKDSGLPNTTGAGNFVQTQRDRAYFYQTYCLKLLESKSCVGWHWYKYLDCDLEDTQAVRYEDANKGILDNSYNLYEPLGNYMKELNLNVYRLINFFDNK